MMLTKSRILLVSAVSVLALAACNSKDAAKNDATVATVNGIAIKASRVDMMVKQGASQGQPDTPELRKKVIENHALKSRAQITVVEGSYLAGTRATPSTQTETYLLDVPNGGTLIARNNVFVKNFSGNNSNAASLTFAVESNSTNYDMTRPWDLTVEHNTFVAFSREYDTSGVFQRWLRPFFINQTSPGTKNVQHNAFVGYCDQANINNNFKGTNYAVLNFNQIDMAFRPRNTLANGSTTIVGTNQYVHEAMSTLRTTRQIGARD